jgi:hypothetical protein
MGPRASLVPAGNRTPGVQPIAIQTELLRQAVFRKASFELRRGRVFRTGICT